MNLKEFKNIGIVHHNKDTDGFLSGALILKLMNENNITDYEFIPYNYEQNIDSYCRQELNLNLNNFDLLFFVDCTPPTEWFVLYLEYSKFHNQKIIIIDHHKNKCEELISEMETIISRKSFSEHEILEQKIKRNGIDITKINFNNNASFVEPRIDSVLEFVEFYVCLSTEKPLSAAHLIFQKYFKNGIVLENMQHHSMIENFVLFCSLYDTWEWFNNDDQTMKIPEALYLETYLRSCWDLKEKSDLEKTNYFLNIINNMLSLESLINYGKELHEIEVDKAKSKFDSFQFIVNLPNSSRDDYENLLVMTSFGEKPSFVNQFYSREYFNDLLNIDIDLMMFFRFDYLNNKVNISMRSIRIDIPMFIKYLNNKYSDENNKVIGGGHKHAAGCSMTFKSFHNMMGSFKFGLGHNHIFNNEILKNKN